MRSKFLFDFFFNINKSGIIFGLLTVESNMKKAKFGAYVAFSAFYADSYFQHTSSP